MTLSRVDILYWAAGFAGHLLLVAIMAYRGLTKRFPFFTSLIAFNLLRSTALLCINLFASRGWYFYSYWSLFAVDIALQLLVMYEIAGSIFRPLGTWASDVRKRGMFLIAASILIGFALILLPRPAVELWYQTWLLKASFLASAVECELFVGIAVLSWEGGFSWNSYVARIASGFALFAFPDMVVEIATTRLGLKNEDAIYQALIHIRMTAYIASLLFWIVALWRKTPLPRRLSQHMSSQVDAINQSVGMGLRALGPERKSE